jgi:hypothetical protein
MRRLAIPALLLLLAACGADAPPFRPTANFGLSVGSDGVTTSTSVEATNGTVSLGVNL